MSVNFKYVPSSGDLSGKSFEEQTEKAFNELGEQIDTIESVSEEASEISNQALAIAQTAETTASNAESIASSAQQEANNAVTQAQSAIAQAGEATTTANTAYDTSIQAQTDAQEAKDLSEQAISTAQSANNAAQEAKDLSEQAKATSDAALSIATNNTGIFIVSADNIDVNALTSPVKYYLTNSSVSNIPVSVPCYISISPTDDGTGATQFCWAASSPEQVYFRTGSATDESTIWDAWRGVSPAVPRGIITMWSGSIASIPAGWALCNGQNSTPNLTDRFIVGAGNNHGPGNTGGATTHSHSVSFTSQYTTLDAGTMPSHAHTGSIGAGSAGPSGNIGAIGITGVLDYGQLTINANGLSYGHAHGVVGTTAASDNRPPYYALAYIMKL